MRDRRLWALTAAAALARVIAWGLRPSSHPDAHFQYLEPAWLHLHGYGWPPWEYAAGVRTWLLPGYHGTWMALLDWAGVRSGGAQARFLQLHWALASALLVPLAFRAAGWLAALLAALLPTLLYYAPQTLTEVPAALLAAWGYALWLETRREGDDRRKLAWAGAVLSFGVCLRIPNAPLLLPPLIDLSLRKRWPALGAALLAALPPVLLFGALDWATWGRPFHAMYTFVSYSFLQGRAAEHGVSPPLEYLVAFGPFIAAATACALLAPKKSWGPLAGALLLVGLLSTQRHKEDRFVLAAWPLLAMAAGAGLQALLEKRPRSLPAALGAVAMICALDGWDLARRPPLDFTGRAGLFDAERFVGEQPDATGLLIEGRFHLSGGFMWLSRNLPLEQFHPVLLQDRIFNYAAVRDGSVEQSWCEKYSFKRIWSERGFSVWRRGDG